MFIQNAFSNPFLFFAVVLTVLISIVLHELAHGWAAIRRGDQTPIWSGRMTGNPLVHMGPFSILALCIAGIAWGQMPVDRTRLRGKYAEAFVAVAGPALNLILAIVSLTALALWLRFGSWHGAEQVQMNAGKFLFLFGSTNAMLCVFNLFPIPPLDGSHILANFHRGYGQLIGDPTKQPIFLLAFIFAFALAGPLFSRITVGTFEYLNLVSGNRVGVYGLFAAIYAG